MKKGSAILFLFLTLSTYSQNSTLLQNINYRASELKHGLNKTSDTLILEGERIIDKVEIFNNDFQRTFIVDNKKTKIPLADIPVGRFVTEVKVKDKLIIITLLRHKILNDLEAEYNSEKYTSTNELTLQNHAEGKVLSAANTKEILEKPPIKVVKFYWIVKYINKGHSSSKKMRIGDKEVVDRMIAQHKIDLKSKAGKRNKLTIWEVYDTSAFLRYKNQNPDFASTTESDCFNVVPFYKTEN